MPDGIFNWPHLMVVTSSSNACSVDPSQRYMYRHCRERLPQALA
jgi:hypothetical protein